jgi:hypothetical protein
MKPKRIFLILLALLLWLAAAAPAVRAQEAPPATAQSRAAAAESLQQVDELLKKASELTGLPIRHKVDSALVNRDSIRRYIQERIEESPGPEKLRAQEVALKKFGFLPAEFDLRAATEQLLTEQAAAYYDPKRQRVYIADWTPIEMQRPAIIHELTHALQDQQVPLDPFLDDQKLNQDEQMARAAVVEGGAVLAMMDYLLSSAGLNAATLPDLDQAVAAATAAEMKNYPVFSSAPLYLRESLLFPYTVGTQYVRAQVQAHGKAGYLDSLKNPPRSTADVMHPGAPVGGVPAGLQPPEVTPLPAGYSRLLTDVLGEFDIRVLLEQYGDAETARRVASGWRGLRFAVYEKQDRSSAFLVHRSRWRDAPAAEAFAAAYRKVLGAKGEKNARLETNGDTVTVYEGVPQQSEARAGQHACLPVAAAAFMVCSN